MTKIRIRLKNGMTRDTLWSADGPVRSNFIMFREHGRLICLTSNIQVIVNRTRLFVTFDGQTVRRLAALDQRPYEFSHNATDGVTKWWVELQGPTGAILAVMIVSAEGPDAVPPLVVQHLGPMVDGQTLMVIPIRPNVAVPDWAMNVRLDRAKARKASEEMVPRSNLN